MSYDFTTVPPIRNLVEPPDRRTTTDPVVYYTQSQNWDDNIYDSFKPDLDAVILNMNLLGDQFNIVAADVSYNSGLAQESAINSQISANDSALSALEARNAADEIEGYVVPVDATYGIDQIDALVDMAEVLYITGA